MSAGHLIKLAFCPQNYLYPLYCLTSLLPKIQIIRMFMEPLLGFCNIVICREKCLLGSNLRVNSDRLKCREVFDSFISKHLLEFCSSTLVAISVEILDPC